MKVQASEVLAVCNARSKCRRPRFTAGRRSAAGCRPTMSSG
jgi:hypothetical protein